MAIVYHFEPRNSEIEGGGYTISMYAHIDGTLLGLTSKVSRILRALEASVMDDTGIDLQFFSVQIVPV